LGSTCKAKFSQLLGVVSFLTLENSLPSEDGCYRVRPCIPSYTPNIRVGFRVGTSFTKKFWTLKTEHFRNSQKRKVRKFPSNAGPYYRAFHGFGQANFPDGGLILCSGQFSILPQLPPWTMLSLKVVKIDPKISNSLCSSQSLTYSVCILYITTSTLELQKIFFCRHTLLDICRAYSLLNLLSSTFYACFFDDILLPKSHKSKITREKLRLPLLYEKFMHKMLMKSTPWVYLCHSFYFFLQSDSA